MVTFIEVVPQRYVEQSRASAGHEGRKKINSHVMKMVRQRQRDEQMQEAADGSAVANGDGAWRVRRQKLRSLRKAQDGSSTQHSGAVITSTRCSEDDFMPIEPASGRRAAATFAQIDSGAAAPDQELPEDPGLYTMIEEHVYRCGVVARFSEGYFSEEIRRSPLFDQVISMWTSVQSGAGFVGNDALGLLHLGSAMQDPRVTLAGQKRYQSALRLVRCELATGLRNLDGVLCGAMDLLSCEIYSAVSSGLEGWHRHIQGLNAIVEMNILRSKRSVFHAFMLLQFRHVALMYALVFRRKMALRRCFWNMGSEPVEPDSIEALTRLVLPLPTLLETADRILAVGDKPAFDRESSWTEYRLFDVELGLQSWFKAYVNRRAQSLTASQLTSKQTARNAWVDSEAFYHTQTLCFYWCLLLLVHEARLDLQYLKSYRSDRINQPALTTDKRLNEVCDCLLASIPTLQKGRGGAVSQAMAVRAPIYFVIRWYRRSNNAAGLAKALDIEETLRRQACLMDWDATLPTAFVPLLWKG